MSLETYKAWSIMDTGRAIRLPYMSPGHRECVLPKDQLAQLASMTLRQKAVFASVFPYRARPGQPRALAYWWSVMIKQIRALSPGNAPEITVSPAADTNHQGLYTANLYERIAWVAADDVGHRRGNLPSDTISALRGMSRYQHIVLAQRLFAAGHVDLPCGESSDWWQGHVSAASVDTFPQQRCSSVAAANENEWLEHMRLLSS